MASVKKSTASSNKKFFYCLSCDERRNISKLERKIATDKRQKQKEREEKEEELNSRFNALSHSFDHASGTYDIMKNTDKHLVHVVVKYTPDQIKNLSKDDFNILYFELLSIEQDIETENKYQEMVRQTPYNIDVIEEYIHYDNQMGNEAEYFANNGMYRKIKCSEEEYIRFKCRDEKRYEKNRIEHGLDYECVFL